MTQKELAKRCWFDGLRMLPFSLSVVCVFWLRDCWW